MINVQNNPDLEFLENKTITIRASEMPQADPGSIGPVSRLPDIEKNCIGGDFGRGGHLAAGDQQIIAVFSIDAVIVVEHPQVLYRYVSAIFNGQPPPAPILPNQSRAVAIKHHLIPANGQTGRQVIGAGS